MVSREAPSGLLFLNCLMVYILWSIWLIGQVVIGFLIDKDAWFEAN